jgi:predicted membrane-bound mannosyltransferase
VKGYENKPDEIGISTGAPPEDKPKDVENLVQSPEQEEATASETVVSRESPDEIAEGALDDEGDYEDDETVDDTPRGWNFSPPTAVEFWTGVAFWGIILFGAVLRFWALGDKPLHHDESLHAYFSRNFLLTNIESWQSCFNAAQNVCYRYDPLTHGPFQFTIMAFVYKIAEWLGVPDHGVNEVTVRIAAASLGSVTVALPYFFRHHLGKLGAWLACFLIAISPGMVYFSHFAREDTYMACFTLLMVVSAAEYIRTRKVGWFILGVLGFVLAYATKEATFLTIAIFGSFLGALFLWELSTNWRLPFALGSSAGGVRAIPAAPEQASGELETDSQTSGEDVEVKGILPAAGEDVEVKGTLPVADEDVEVKGTLPVADEDVEVKGTLPAADEDVEVEETSQPIPAKFLPARPVVLLAYLAVLAILAKVFFGWLKYLGELVKAAQEAAKGASNNAADQYVEHLKQVTVTFIPWIGILLALLVVGLLVAEHFGYISTTGRGRLARKVDPGKQPLLDTIVTMPWTHWFFGFVLGWTVFLLLFTALFTYIPNGIGDGIWQGIYYWLQQQDVQRGGQPWYYYLMLIPLYEVVGVVFGLVGIVRSLMRPTRFRLFLIWWFAGSLLIYSWAGEKMPWLMIHITTPLLLLAAIGLQPAVERIYQSAKDWYEQRKVKAQENAAAVAPGQGNRGRLSLGGAIVVCVLALFLLTITLQNMMQVTYVHPAAAQNEMMIYVQTTPYVPATMSKIQELDQKYYGGKREIPVGVMADVVWPFVWYLRDYTRVCLNYQLGADCYGGVPPVIIADQTNMEMARVQYSQTYFYHTYEMRAQWNQGYMPPPCQPTPCKDQAYTGVGPLSWLSYGNNPPSVGAFDLSRMLQNIWQWWWTRKPFGGVDTGYEMGILFRKDLGIQP